MGGIDSLGGHQREDFPLEVGVHLLFLLVVEFIIAAKAYALVL